MEATATPRAGGIPGILVRSLVVGLFAAAAAVVPGMVDDPGAAELMPHFVALAFVQLLPLIFSTRRDLFAPPIYTGIVGAVGTIAMGSFLAEQGPATLPFRHDDPAAQIELVRLSIWVLCLGVMAYQLGYFLKARPGIARRLPNVAGLVWERSRLVVVVVVVLIAAALAYAAFQLQLDVPLTELTRLREGREALSQDPTETWMIRGMQFGFLPGLLLLSHAFWRGRGLRGLAVALGLTVIVAALVFRTSSRGVVAQVLICSTILFHYLRHRVRVSAFIALYIVGISLANIAFEWRSPTGDRERAITIETLWVNPLRTLSAHESERSRLDAVASIVYYFPEREDYLYGKSWVAFLVVPIPRWIWPEKREFTRWADNSIPYEIIGLKAPPAFPAVLYANFSWIGIAVGMFLFGMFHRGLYDWLMRAPGDPNVVLLYSVGLLYFAPTLLGVSASLQYILPLWLVLRFISRRKPAENATPRAPGTLGASLESS